MTATQVPESGKDSNSIQKREVTDNTERVKRSDKGSPQTAPPVGQKDNLGVPQKVNRFDGGTVLMSTSLDEVLQDSENLEDIVESNANSIQQTVDQKDTIETARLNQKLDITPKADPIDF